MGYVLGSTPDAPKSKSRRRFPSYRASYCIICLENRTSCPRSRIGSPTDVVDDTAGGGSLTVVSKLCVPVFRRVCLCQQVCSGGSNAKFKLSRINFLPLAAQPA